MSSIALPLAGRPADVRGRLTLDASAFRRLFKTVGPSLGLWRGAEVAALRTCPFVRPVLDLGCGDGVVTSLVLSHVEHGVDPWSEAIARAAAGRVYGCLEQAPIEQSALPDESVRTIVSNSVLEHIGPIDDVLSSAARRLVPGGRLIFTVPTEAFGDWLLVPSARYARWRNRSYEHRNLWTVEQWARRLAQAGLEIEMARSYLRRPLVRLWDGLELAQRVWIGRRRVVGEAWKRLPSVLLAIIARLASRLDLSSPPPGGGRLIVARRH